MLTSELGDRDPITGRKITDHQALRGGQRQQHVRRASSPPHGLAHALGRDRSVLVQPREQVELRHRGDQQVRGIRAIANAIQPRWIKDVVGHGQHPAPLPPGCHPRSRSTRLAAGARFDEDGGATPLDDTHPGNPRPVLVA